MVVDGVSGATKNFQASKSCAVSVNLTPGYDTTTYALIDFADCIRINKLPASNIHTGKWPPWRSIRLIARCENEATERWKPEYNL